MSGFLAGLVQRGASVPGRGVEPAIAPAPLSTDSIAGPFSLEAPPHSEVFPTPPSMDAPSIDPSAINAPVVHVQSPAPPVGPLTVQVSNLALASAQHAHNTQVDAAGPFVAARSTEQSNPRIEAHAPIARPAAPMADPQVSAERPREIAREVVSTMPVARAHEAQSEPARSAPRERPTAPAVRVTNPGHDVSVVRVDAAPIEASAWPRIETQFTAAPPVADPPPIHVRIGKVEVRPAAPRVVAPSPQTRSSAPAALGFAAYRRLRTYRN